MSDDWSGGGYGRYPGLSMTDIRHRFDQCVADSSPRSISAIFRIAHEQIEARGRLGLNLGAAKVSLVLGMICFIASPFLPTELRGYALDGGGIGVVGGAILGLGAFRIRHAVQMNLVQERQIRQAALEAIESILNQGVEPHALTREQRDLLKEMIRKERYQGTARDLLAVQNLP